MEPAKKLRSTEQSQKPTMRLQPLDQPPPPREDIIAGSLWMVGISIVLFFLPIINGFIGGLVGGYKVGSVNRALVSAILPAIAVAAGLWLLLGLLQLPLVGFFAGVAVAGWIVLSDLGLFVGAAIGGALGARSLRKA